MDIKQIQELVKLVNKSNIGELSIEKEGFKITIKQKKEATQHFASPMIQQAPQPQQMSLPSVAPEKTSEQKQPKLPNQKIILL